MIVIKTLHVSTSGECLETVRYFSFTCRRRHCEIILRYQYGRDPRSYELYLSSSELGMKIIQARTGFKPMAFAIPMQRSPN